MDHPICVRCGVQFAAMATPPARCPVCDDERETIAAGGQQWITLAALRTSHHNRMEDIEPGLTAIATEPSFAIGQQTHLIATPAGNLLWNCISLVDDETVAAIAARGGVAAIAISHPHFSASMVEWGQAFGSVPIWLHGADRAWMMRPDPVIRYWDGDAADPVPGSGLTLIRCGGHFPGSCVLHWRGADGAGALLTGDTIQVVADRRWVSFMYSYPNLIPLDAASVNRIVAAVEPYQFSRLYGSWPGNVVAEDAKAAIHRSAARYIARISG